MPKYKFKFERTYETTEGFERVIEAPSLAEAEAAAKNLSIEFDMDCPDDCMDYGGGEGAGNFEVDCVSSDTAETTDYSVQIDGQCVPHG